MSRPPLPDLLPLAGSLPPEAGPHIRGGSRERFEKLAARIGSRSRPAAGPALREEYWRSLHELFTRDVTHADLSRLLQHELRETFSFLTREVDTSDLHGLPWWRRHPRALVRFFLAVAYRLSPWRRVLFAASMIALAIAWLAFALGLGVQGPFSLAPLFQGHSWLLVAATLFAFLLVLELRDKLSLKGDLEIARQIQFGLLPFDPWDKDGVRIETAMRPANTVGGDYFDVIELGDGRLAVAVGDVAGKGMPAALLMALLQGSLRTLVSAGLRGAELMASLNAHLCANIPSNRLITLVYAELDPATGQLRYVNAGHNPPLVLRRAGGRESLDSTGRPLGLLPGGGYEERRVTLGAGDALLLFTDGVVDLENEAGDSLGMRGLLDLIERDGLRDGDELLPRLAEALRAWRGSKEPPDDATLVVLRLGRDASASSS